MPRMGRLHVDGGCYHVIGRGIERRNIFETDEDKTDFIDRLSDGLRETEISCLAWSVMSNHYHLLLRVKTSPLSSLMQGVLGGYAAQYNRRHKRVGYVYQNRFKSILCQEETYLLTLVRYIHLNPIKARMLQSIGELDVYPWTGHSVLMGSRRCDWQQTEPVLSRFGKTIKEARSGYKDYVTEGIGLGDEDFSGGGLIRSHGGWELVGSLRREHIQRIGDERILGDGDFIENMLALDDIGLTENARYQHTRRKLSDVVQTICVYFDIPIEDASKKGRANDLAKARCVIAYLATTECGFKGIEVADYLSVTSAAVSKMKRQGRDFCVRRGLNLDVLRKIS